MADNVIVGGNVIAADEIGGVQWQRFKIGFGPDGEASDVAPANALPVTQVLNVTSPLTSAPVSASSAGDNTLIAASSGMEGRVYALHFIVDAATVVVLKSGGSPLTGAMLLAAGGTINLDLCNVPHFTTGTNEAFILNLNPAVEVNGWIQYVRA